MKTHAPPSTCHWGCRRGHFRGRGAAFIVALLVVTVLTGVVLVFARGMNTSADAARGAVSQHQARWIAQGALEAIRGELAEKLGLDEPPRLDTVGVQAEPMGGGYYWVIGRDPAASGSDGVVIDAGPEDAAFGLVSEAGKLDLLRGVIDAGESASALSTLPGLTPTLVDSLREYMQEVDENEEGELTIRLEAPSTVDELLLVVGFLADTLDGEDANRNGVLDTNEDDGDASPPDDNGDGRLDRGLRDFVTVYSNEPNTADSGDERIFINRRSRELAAALEAIVDAERFAELVDSIPANRPYASTMDFYVRAKLEPEEFAQIHDQLTTDEGETLTGKIDVYHAPAGVLDALPGLDPGDGARIVAARPMINNGEVPGDFVWLIDAIGKEKAQEVGRFFTHRSLQLSADIVAVSGDGRGFCRLRYVLDLSPIVTGDAEAPRVLHVQDLTSLGWPLDPAILDDLRRGVAAEDFVSRYGPTGL